MSNLRKDTLSRLHNCDCNIPAPPFPSHVMPISLFEEMLYKVIYSAGYEGTKKEFLENFITILEQTNIEQLSDFVVQSDSVSNFPETGDENSIYIDTSTQMIYFWKDNQYIQTKYEKEKGPVVPDDGLIYDGGVL